MSDKNDEFEHGEILKETFKDIHASIANDVSIKGPTGWKQASSMKRNKVMAFTRSNYYVAVVSIMIVLAVGTAAILSTKDASTNSPDKVKTVDKIKNLTTTTTTNPNVSTTISASPLGSKNGSKNPDTTKTTNSGIEGIVKPAAPFRFPNKNLSATTETSCGFSSGSYSVANKTLVAKKDAEGNVSLTFYKPFNFTYASRGNDSDRELIGLLNTIQLNKETVIGNVAGSSIYNLYVTFDDSVHSNTKETSISFSRDSVHVTFGETVLINALNYMQYHRLQFTTYAQSSTVRTSLYSKYFGTNSTSPDTQIETDSTNLALPWSSSPPFILLDTHDTSYTSFSYSAFSPTLHTLGYPGCSSFIKK